MAQITTKFIKDNAVVDTKIRLQNQGWLRARNQANSADINILEVDGSDTIQIASVPQLPADPVSTADVARKNYVDQVVSNLLDKAKTEYFTLSSGDIVNGFITLSNPAFLDSVEVFAGGVGQVLNLDYSLSTPSVNTVVTFLSPLTSILQIGDEVSVSYNVAASITSAGPIVINLLREVAVINNTVASGNGGGGSMTPGTWNTRPLDTVQAAQPWLSLASNQFTLQPGTYEIEGSAGGFYVNVHQTRIQNITDSSTAIIGTGEYAETGVGAQSRSFVEGVITITTAKTFEFQHYPQLNNDATQGMGVAVGYAGFDVYAQLKIAKLKNVSSLVFSNSTGSSVALSVGSPGPIVDSSSVPLTLNLVCGGGPIEIGLQDDGLGGAGSLDFINVSTTNSWPQVFVLFYEDGTLISTQRALVGANTTFNHGAVPASSFSFRRTPTPGVHTYTVQAYVLDADGGSPTGTAQSVMMYGMAK